MSDKELAAVVLAAYLSAQFTSRSAATLRADSMMTWHKVNSAALRQLQGMIFANTPLGSAVHAWMTASRATHEQLGEQAVAIALFVAAEV